nr:MAG TPA: hypothetical protein [Caudoviricetes sp.]
MCLEKQVLMFSCFLMIQGQANFQLECQLKMQKSLRLCLG